MRAAVHPLGHLQRTLEGPGKLTLPKLIEKLTVNPAKLLKIDSSTLYRKRKAYDQNVD